MFRFSRNVSLFRYFPFRETFCYACCVKTGMRNKQNVSQNGRPFRVYRCFAKQNQSVRQKRLSGSVEVNHSFSVLLLVSRNVSYFAAWQKFTDAEHAKYYAECQLLSLVSLFRETAIHRVVKNPTCTSMDYEEVLWIRIWSDPKLLVRVRTTKKCEVAASFAQNAENFRAFKLKFVIVLLSNNSSKQFALVSYLKLIVPPTSECQHLIQYASWAGHCCVNLKVVLQVLVQTPLLSLIWSGSCCMKFTS